MGIAGRAGALLRLRLRPSEVLLNVGTDETGGGASVLVVPIPPIPRPPIEPAVVTPFSGVAGAGFALVC